MRLLDDSEHGPACRFGDAHIFLFLMNLDEKKPISRLTMAEITGIGEGSIRKIIEVLKKWGAITVKQTGITLSPHGQELLLSLPIRKADIMKSEYVIGAYQKGVLIRGASEKITNGAYQRDRGIMAGANGASVFIISEGRLIMPRNWDMDTRDPEFSQKLRSNGMEEGDVMIICGANNPTVAATAAVSIALDLL
jgi:predicted transcriptional regulator